MRSPSVLRLRVSVPRRRRWSRRRLPPGAPAVESAPSSLVGLDPELPAGTAGLLAPCVGGVSVLPYHPYTQASAKPVTPGTVTEYQIQIFPTLATIAAGNQLRLTLATTDTPHLVPLPGQLPQLAGGVYTIARSATAPSSLTVETLK